MGRVRRLIVGGGAILWFGWHLCSSQSLPAACADHDATWNELITTQGLEACVKHFEVESNRDPSDESARCLWGITRVLHAVEGLGQSWYRFGVRDQFYLESVPFFRLPIPSNADPELVSYDKVRFALEEFAKEIESAQKALAQPADSDFKLVLKIGKVQFDWNDDDKRSSAETFKAMLQEISPAALRTAGDDIEVGIDSADIAWLRGYCHVLLALSEVVLAHDQKELFERCGHLFFTKIDSPYLLTQYRHADGGFDPAFISDLIAAIHLCRFPCREPARMRKAHDHLLAMVEESRLFWKLATEESDNDREWIPSPTQTGILQVPVNRELVRGWNAVLNELEAILKGEKLVPYWRIYPERGRNKGPLVPEEGTGINVRRVFLEPREFDLVLMVQGSGWEVYLEDGKLSTPQAWEQLTRVFGGRFFGFAAWFN
ncbi:hypothetical protein VN12_25515 [Pirellula sp. SH-Sr6A]|uniref:hypothetical protein n=1 Tax=Pirellula sp. SH-Sr6A TaxID=1632865 RepID=UPI00078D2891|nr:hypothetical protein [Pirellula sp. SH-Sr6A]AMV35475.1 hypothetical protein VN12_25515 [Pirellula sp. SH-Sr6A]